MTSGSGDVSASVSPRIFPSQDVVKLQDESDESLKSLKVQMLLSLMSPEPWLTEHCVNTYFYYPTPVTVCSLVFQSTKVQIQNDTAYCTKY